MEIDLDTINYIYIAHTFNGSLSRSQQICMIVQYCRLNNKAASQIKI
jgi:hypothetical protein